MELAVREAKARLSELIAAAQKGERVVITKRGFPAVELVRCPPQGGLTPRSWRRRSESSASKETESAGPRSSTIRRSADVYSVSIRRTDRDSCVEAPDT